MHPHVQAALLEGQEVGVHFGPQGGGNALGDVAAARREAEQHPPLVLQTKGHPGVRQRQPKHRLLAVPQLRLLSPEKLPARRHGVKEVLHHHLRARPGGGGPDAQHLTCVHADFRAHGGTGFRRPQQKLGDGGHRGQGLPPEAKRRDALQPGQRAQLAGGVPTQRERRVLGRHPPSVVHHLNSLGAATLQADEEALRSSVERVFAELLHHRRRALDDLAGGDLVDQLVAEQGDGLQEVPAALLPTSGAVAVHPSAGMGQARSARMMRVALTGPTGDFGTLLLPRLRDDARVSRILTLGTRGTSGPRLTHHRVDLTRYDVESELVDLLGEAQIDVLYHLAFLHGRTRSGAFAHEVEVIGTLHVLAAAARAGVKKLVVPSYTLVYGARPDNPALLTEDAPLHGSSTSRFVSDRVEVEKQVAAFRTAHPEVEVTVFRFAPVLGPTADNPATRFFRRPVAPTLLGFDPLWQAVHEEDACSALLQALDRPAAGVFNVVSADVLPLSAMIGLARSRALPLPAPLARAILRGLNTAGVTATPVTLLDYLHYACVADGTRCRQVLDFVPRYSARQALQALRT